MKRLIIAAIVLVAGALPSWCSSGGDREAAFFSGLILLQSATLLPAEQKAAKYRELQMMTGITGAKAKALLSVYRNRPEEWQRLYSTMQSLLNEVKPLPPVSGTGTEQKNSR
jgi:hypothetical protein